MFDPAKIGVEIFDILRSYNYAVVMFDEQGSKTFEPADAVRFFTDKKNLTVSVHEQGENSAIEFIIGKKVDLKEVQGLNDTLRHCATKFGIIFNTERSDQVQFEPKDFAHLYVVEEGATLTGSTKTSYLKLEGARMIVRHDSAIDAKKHGARGRNVRKVFVENSEGERFLMPSQNLMAGRAMTRHVSKGGQFHDDVGGKITEMATQQQHMRACASYCRQNKKLDEDVSAIVEACTARAKTIRNTFEGLYRRYEKTLKEMEKEPDNLLLETDDERLEEKVEALKNKLQLEDESVVDRPTCESVVRVLGESDLLEKKGEELVHLQALDREDFVARVETSAWSAFAADPPAGPKIRFINNQAPDLRHVMKNLSAALSLVAKSTEADGLSNLLADVAQRLENGDSDTLLKHIAHRACRAALDHPNKGAPEALVKTPSKDMERVPESRSLKGLIVTESVKELDEWFAGFDEEKIFEDDWGSRYPKSNPSEDDIERGLNDSISTVESDFNVDDFLVMSGSDFNYGDTGLSSEDKEISVDELISSLKHYLNGEIAGEMSAHIEGDSDDFGDITDVAKRVLPDLISRLEEEGYTVTGQEALEDDSDDDLDVGGDDIKFDHRMLDETGDEDSADGLDDNEELLLGGEESDLSAEDVIMPSDPAADLKKEVAADTDEDDTDYVNRLLTLAGRARNDAPKTVQP